MYWYILKEKVIFIIFSLKSMKNYFSCHIFVCCVSFMYFMNVPNYRTLIFFRAQPKHVFYLSKSWLYPLFLCIHIHTAEFDLISFITILLWFFSAPFLLHNVSHTSSTWLMIFTAPYLLHYLSYSSLLALGRGWDRSEASRSNESNVSRREGDRSGGLYDCLCSSQEMIQAILNASPPSSLLPHFINSKVWLRDSWRNRNSY